MRRVVLLIFYTLFNTPLAVAVTSQNVFSNMAHEMVECAAYFGAMSTAFKHSNKPAEEKSWKEFHETAIERAFLLTELAGLKPETVRARYDMAVRDMIKRIDNDTTNISILMADYNELCVEVITTDVRKRGQYWMERLEQ